MPLTVAASASMSFKFSPSLAPWLARLTILLAFVSPTIQGTISARAGTIDDVFHIKTGTEKGGCDNYDVIQWWNDGRVLAGAADQVLRNARTSKANGVTNSDSQKHLWTFFKLDAADDSFDSILDAMIGMSRSVTFLCEQRLTPKRQST